MEGISISGDTATLCLKWMNWADTDYVASRQLLRSNMIVPGVCLANTSIEKYIKSLYVLLDEKIPHGHNIPTLYDNISPKFPRLSLNEEFLKVLYKAYKLRYPDELEIDYNLSLCTTKILAELDFTVFEIRKGFEFKSSKSEVITSFDQLIKNESEQLLDKNCYFGLTLRGELFGEVSSVYECRVLSNGNLMEITYLTEEPKDDRKFMNAGLVPNDSNARDRSKF